MIAPGIAVERFASSAAIALLLALALWGCRSTPTHDDSDSGALEAISLPALERLEREVQERLRHVLAEAKSTPDSDPTARGRAYGEAGLVFHAYSFHAAAAGCYRNAARLTPDELIWPYLLGQTLGALHRDTESTAAFKRALSLDPDHPQTLVRLGYLMLDGESLVSAAAYFDSALAAAPELSAARFGRGKVALAGGEFRLAVDLFEETLKQEPEATAVQYPLALAYRGLGDKSQAQAHLRLRGPTVPHLDDPFMQRVVDAIDGMRVHQLRGTESYRQGRYDEARGEFEAALQAQPDSSLVLTNLALTLIQLDDPLNAEKHLRRAIEITPDDTFAHYNLGTLLASREAYSAAIDEFERTLAVDPQHRMAQTNIANALCKAGRCAESVGWYERASEADPGNPGLRVGLARALGATGRWSAAAALLEEAHRERPNVAEIRSALARVLAAAPDDAVRTGRRALQIAQPLLGGEPAFEQTETFAMVAAENGHFAQAVELQIRLIEAAAASRSDSRRTFLADNLRRYRAGIACRSPWGDAPN